MKAAMVIALGLLPGAGCSPASPDAPAIDASARDHGAGDVASDDSATRDMASDGTPVSDMASDGFDAAGMSSDDSVMSDMASDGALVDMASDDSAVTDMASDGMLGDARPVDQGAVDQGAVDQGPAVGLHVVGAHPPRIAWVRGGQAEIARFDPLTGPGPPVAMGPPGVDGARFVAIDDAVHLAWSDPGGVWLGADDPRHIADGALRGLAAFDGAIVALTTDADPRRGRLVIVDPAGMRAEVAQVFEVEPDARELLGLAATADGIGVLTGDARSDGLYLYRFARGPGGALLPEGRVPVCDFGCDRPRARIAGGPALGVLYQSTGELHRVVGDARVALADVWRGGPLDLRHDGGWVAVWSTASDRGPGVFVDGVELHAGPVREVAAIDASCAVWLADGVGWACR